MPLTARLIYDMERLKLLHVLNVVCMDFSESSMNPRINVVPSVMFKSILIKMRCPYILAY